MSTETRNEAAERLRKWMLLFTPSSHLLDRALAAERRATVERIEDALDVVHLVRDSNRQEGYDTHQVRAILAVEVER